jgi:hypothetical protein
MVHVEFRNRLSITALRTPPYWRDLSPTELAAERGRQAFAGCRLSS